MKVKIHCSACNGTGLVESQSLTETLAVLRSGEWFSTKRVYAEIPGSEHVGPTAVNNRLVALEKLGLAICEKRGRNKYWKAKKK